MSEEVVFKALSSGNSGATPHPDGDGHPPVINAQPRFGRSKILAREELMYANHQTPQQQYQLRTNSGPGYRGPLHKNIGTQSSVPVEKLSQEYPQNSVRRTSAAGPRRLLAKDQSAIEDDSPLQRYENALSRYRKTALGGASGSRKERREALQNIGNNGYSSSDESEGAISRYHKSKSTSSIDTQSVNNILDEYEDLDYGRSSDLSDSGSISVTNFEVVMDQRKRQQQQQQHTQLERSKETVAREEDVCKEREGQPHHDQRAKNMSEKLDPIFKVNQQTQVRQRSRDRQSNPASSVNTTKESGNKLLNSGNEDHARGSKQDATSGVTSENRCAMENLTVMKQPPEVLLRKGEVQKRVDEWLNQTQAQNFAGANSGKRDSGRPAVALVRSSSSAESKNLRRSRNDARSRSTDENGSDKLNGTASYDDINRTEVVRSERKLERPKNVATINASRGTYKDYLAGRNRSRHPTDYGFVGHGSNARPGESISGNSKIPQRGPASVRRREVSSDRNTTTANETMNVTVPSAAVTLQHEKNSLQCSRFGAVEARNTSGGFGKTRTEQASCNGGTTVSPGILANGRAASFKRARSQERNNAIASGRNTGALLKEDQQSTTGNSRTRSGSHHHQHHNQLVSKGQLSRADQQQKQQNNVTSPNKVGESRRLLVASREPRVHGDPTEQVCKSAEESINSTHQQPEFLETIEKQRDILQTQETNIAKCPLSCRSGTEGTKDLVPNSGDSMTENSTFNTGLPGIRGRGDSKTPKSKFLQGNSAGIEPRRPPAPPRRDQSRRDRTEEAPTDERQVTDEPCSSFRPSKRIFSPHHQFNEHTTFSTNSDNRGATCESSKSHYASPKQVEKIYERTLQPQVIHSNDLESVLKPVVRASAYGESGENDTTKIIKEQPWLTDNTMFDGTLDDFHDRLGNENKMIESPKTTRFPEIGLDQCLMVQRRNPSTKSTSKDSSLEKRGMPTIHTKCWDQDSIVEPAKTFGTFQPTNSTQASSHLDERIEKIDAPAYNPDMHEGMILEVTTEPTYQEPDLIPKLKVSLIDSYEARSTLRLDRNLTSGSAKYPEAQTQNQGDPHRDSAGPRISPWPQEPKISGAEEKKSVAQDSDGSELRPIVNEVLVKNLRFQQDLPKPDFQNVFRSPKPFNFNSVLSDDYDKIHADDCAAKEKEECKIYVTKEEMERQRLMDLLKRGDFESVKLELERSYTLSTPGGGSPVCCPPCSPPPAPAAYISSVRASSRRLPTGNGLSPTSPDRDPLAKLLRYLKTFYRELGTRDPRHLPPWASPLPLGTLCPAHFQPHLQLVHKSEQEHRLENIKIDQIFALVRLSDGTISEAPRRVAVEGGPGSGKTTLCLRLLHHWATQGDGPALAFLVPLRELRGSPLLNYLARELFPRTSALGDAVAQVWRTLHLMEDRVLFVLDGYDECLGGRASLGDAADLLEGRLFPDARILVTCSPSNSSTLSPLVQRRIHLAGLEWPHVERLCVAYFIHNDLAEKACEFLEALNVQSTPVKHLVQHPLGWVMLCALYQDSGSLPSESSALVQAAIKCIVRRSLDRPVPHDEEIPGHCRKRLEDFGKLALSALREGRCCYTEAELRARGGGIEVTRLGFLSRGLNFGQRRKADLYTPIHMAVAEFLAAYYLTSVAQYSNILRRELEGLPSGIIGHLAGLLGPKTHLILNQLSPLEVPPRTVFSLLKAAGPSDGNISAVCRLVGAGPGFGPAPNDRPPAPLVQTSPLELEGWTRILESSACTLEALEVVFQVERGSDPSYLNDFFEALAANESVKLVRITSLLGQDFAADEAQRLAAHLKSVLSKKRLNDFELVITCLEESAHDRLECVVNALCRGLSHASNNLARLVLDMNLSGEQVSRVCEALRDCVQVQALHLPHLSCGCEGLASVAELLKERPLLALNLAGSWGAKNEDPSSSGISSGSGSGSSGCASSNLGTLPLNRCYSSLPRGALAAYGSMTRPATLPRLPLGLGIGPSPGNGNALPTNDRDRESNGSSKRNSDSVLCHRLPLMHPLPTCDVTSHQGTGFHEIFNAIREPNCKLRSLNVSKCLQGGLDAGCLGETIRRARYLDALRASGASRPADVMPLVLALTEAPCLQLLDLASPRLALDDHPSRLLCHALARNGTLRLLSLEGWTFRIEESDSLAVFSELLMCTSVRELSLCNARLHLAVHEGPLSRLGRRDDAGAELLRAAPPPACPTIVFLRLAGFQVTVNDRPALRGPLLLPFLAGFTSLSELDLSLDKSEIGGSSSSLLFIDDKILQHFFACFSSNFRNLQSLRINYWRISLEDSERTMRQISKNLKLCNLSFLKANGLIVTDSAKKIQMEHVFLQTVLANLHNLTWLCLDGVKLTESQASSVGKCIRDRYPGTGLEISAKDIHVKSIKSLVSAIEDAGRAEVVYTGGSSCRLKITKVQKNGKPKKK
ncbi:uncharacterized protein [Venturia canescens]|uniref:uncharacterized protein isoform X2 n=1 Tax=Venturia canescens TaxID=32260 RepID=UPI001C9D0230|nr:uncharacterized protein LOC122410138 isoform X2 [Venturia canescens]